MSTEMRNAFVFPGMGPTSFSDVAKFMVVNPFARELVAEADDVLGYSLVDRYREEEGDYSESAQVAFMVNCVALARWAEHTFDVRPDVCAGPSFGGKAAAVHSGALPFADAVWLTAEFARCLTEYFAVEHTDAVTLSFARTAPEALAGITGELTELGVWHEVSCRVDEDFAMLTLSGTRIDWLRERLRAAGGLPLYTMRPPMHCEAFEGLADKVDIEVLGKLEFADPVIPVIDDHDGTVHRSAHGVRSMLLDGCVRQVDWPVAVATMRRAGVGKVLVCGQDALFGRVRATTGNFEVVAVDPRLAMRPKRRS
ncbi:ACP S-malonyltransferase [Amycolatopsis lurida]